MNLEISWKFEAIKGMLLLEIIDSKSELEKEKPA